MYTAASPFLAAALVCFTSAAAAQTMPGDLVEATASVGASATVAVRIAVLANPDFIRGTVRLQSSKGTAGRDDHRSAPVTDVALSPISLRGSGGAIFVLSGEAGQSLSVVLPQTIQLNKLGGSQSVTIAITTDIIDDAAPQVLVRGPGGRGILSFNVRGTLAAAGAQPGDYRGTWAATAQYN